MAYLEHGDQLGHVLAGLLGVQAAVLLRPIHHDGLGSLLTDLIPLPERIEKQTLLTLFYTALLPATLGTQRNRHC